VASPSHGVQRATRGGTECARARSLSPRWMVVAAGLFLAAALAATPVGRPAPRPVEGAPNPRELDLADLVPPQGRLDYVWYVAAGATVPQVVVAWRFQDLRPVIGLSQLSRGCQGSGPRCPRPRATDHRDGLGRPPWIDLVRGTTRWLVCLLPSFPPADFPVLDHSRLANRRSTTGVPGARPLGQAGLSTVENARRGGPNRTAFKPGRGTARGVGCYGVVKALTVNGPRSATRSGGLWPRRKPRMRHWTAVSRRHLADRAAG
jgi:hypothetical protein